MAEFNAFPAMSIQPAKIDPGIDLGSVFQQVEQVKGLQNRNSLFPLEQQQLQQQNQLGQFAVQQAQEADKYGKIYRALQSIDDDDPAAASKEWDNAFSQLGPEGKQWLGKYALEKKDKALKTYGELGMQAGAKAKAAAQVGNMLGGGGQNAFQPTDSQIRDMAQMKPEQLQALVQKANYASAEADKLAKASDPAQAWKDLQESDTEFKTNHPGEYRADEARQIIQNVRAKKQYIDQLSSNAQLGIPQQRDKLQGINVGGGVFGTFDPYDGFKETYRAPETEHEKNEDAAARERNAIERLKVTGGGAGGNPEVVQNFADGVRNGNVSSLNQVPQALRPAVLANLNDMSAGKYSPLAASRFSAASNRIVQNYIKLPDYQLTANGKPYLQRIEAAFDKPGSVADQDLLDSLTKLNTGGNQVTEAQVKVITDGKSLSDWENILENRFKKGGVLSQDQRQQIYDLSHAVYKKYQEGYQPVYDQASKQLEDAGIPKSFWTIPDLNKLSTVKVSKDELPSGVSEEDVQHTMQLRNMTRDEVIKKLKAK